MDAKGLVKTAVVSGALGWAIENTFAYDRPFYSRVFGGRRIPFLPIWAAGGVIAAAIRPRMEKRHRVDRLLTYAAMFTTLELVVCVVDRSLGGRSWDYSPGGEDGCVDLKHALAWGVMGAVAEVVL